jgi:hypothetical protein
MPSLWAILKRRLMSWSLAQALQDRFPLPDGLFDEKAFALTSGMQTLALV